MDFTQMNDDYLRRLYAEIDKYIKTGQRGNLLQSIYNLSDDFIESLRRELFIQLNTLGTYDLKQMKLISSPILDSYSRFGSEIEKKLKKIFYDDKTDFEEKKLKVKNLMKGSERYADTLLNTGLGVITQATNVSNTIKAGGKYFQYIGAIAERKFCQTHLNKVYTLNEINQMDNKQRLPVLFYRGGYNCRHFWKPISGDQYKQIKGVFLIP